MAVAEDRADKALEEPSAEPAVVRLAARVEAAHRQAFLRAIAAVRGRIDVEALARALLAGRGSTEEIDAALRALPADLEAGWRAVLSRGFLEAAHAAQLATPGTVTLNLALINAEAVAWAARAAAARVVQVEETTRAALRGLVAESVAGQRDVRATARLIRDVVGLDERRAQAVDAAVQGWREAGRDEATIARKADRLAQAYLRERATTIARTEVIAAANRGQEALWDLAKREGRLDPGTARRVWIATEDDRVDETCLDLDGETAPLTGGTYPGGYTGPPAHPMCRCAQGLVFGPEA